MQKPPPLRSPTSHGEPATPKSTRHEARQRQVDDQLSALQSHVERLETLPLRTPQEVQAALAKAKAFAAEFHVVKKSIQDLRPLTGVFARLSKASNAYRVAKDTEFYEAAMAKAEALSEQFGQWELAVKQAQQEFGGGESEYSNMKTKSSGGRVLMKTVSMSKSFYRDSDSGESVTVRRNSSCSRENLEEEDGGSKMIVLKRESQEIVKMGDGSARSAKFGGSGGSCIVEEIEEDPLALEDGSGKINSGSQSSELGLGSIVDVTSRKDDDDNVLVWTDSGNSNLLEYEGSEDGFGVFGGNESQDFGGDVEFSRRDGKGAESSGSNFSRRMSMGGEEESKKTCDGTVVDPVIRYDGDLGEKGRRMGAYVESCKDPPFQEFEERRFGKSSVGSGAPNIGSPEPDGSARKRSMDVDSKLRKWRREVNLEEESPLPAWGESFLAEEEQEEFENLKEALHLRQENMNVPVKVPPPEELKRAFLDKKSQEQLHGFHRQTNLPSLMTSLDAAEEDMMGAAGGDGFMDTMNEIAMMEKLLIHNKILENPMTNSLKWGNLDSQGNTSDELEKTLDRAPPGFRKFTDVYPAEDEEDRMQAQRNTRRPKSQHIYKGGDSKTVMKEKIVGIHLVQAQRPAERNVATDCSAEDVFVKKQSDSAPVSTENKVEDNEEVEEATMRKNTKCNSVKNHLSGFTFNIQNSTNCFFPENMPAPPQPAAPPQGVDVVPQSASFRELEKRVAKVEEMELKVEHELEKKSMEEITQSQIKTIQKAHKKDKKQLLKKMVTSAMTIAAAGLSYAIYNLDNFPPPT